MHSVLFVLNISEIRLPLEWFVLGGSQILACNFHHPPVIEKININTFTKKLVFSEVKYNINIKGGEHGFQNLGQHFWGYG